jgi:hypothetical protein
MEEQLQEQNSAGQQYYQPTIMASEKADLYDKINPSDVVNTIKYQLMGYQYDPQRRIWIKNIAMQHITLTEVGATQVATFMLPLSSKNVSITNLKADEIQARIKALMRELMYTCLRNWKEYGMKTPAHFYLVKSVVLSNTFITLKQPENAGVRKFMQGTTQEQHLISEQPRQGIIGGLFRR